MSELAYIRKEFVKQVLQQEGKELHDNQGKAIAKLLHFHSNRLMNERPYSVQSEDAMDGEFSISIPGYGRALDIKPKNLVIREQDKYTHWRQRRRSKAFPIYNRFVFGHYYTIAWRLMYGLTEEVAENIKKQFEAANNGK
ncbi:MAG: hypothetical protein ACK5JD_06385 [Mangrovibacterium sp.]